MVYRGQRGTPGATAGIHWSTSRDVANSLLHSEGEVLGVELTDPEKQAIPYGALYSSRYDEKKGAPVRDSMASMQGFPSEEEVRLRPGAKFNVNGRDVEIDNTRGHIVYPNIHRYAATPEAANREWFHAANELGHTQTAMLDSVHEGDGPAKGYVTSYDLREGGHRDASDEYTDDILKFGHHPEADWFPSHEGRSMDQYVKPPKYRDRAPEAAASSAQFHQHYDVPLPGMDHA